MVEKFHKLDIRKEFLAEVLPITTIPKENLKNGILVRMPNWLGDAVMALPALHQLKLMLPEHCALGVVCPKFMSPLFCSLPWVDNIIGLGNTHQSWSKQERLQVKKFGSGVAILFNNSLRDTIMLRLCRIPRIYGAAMRGRSVLLNRSMKFPPRKSQAMNELHHSNKYLSIAYALGAPLWDGKLPEIKIAEPFFQQRSIIRSLCDHPKTLILAAGAAYGAAKRWSSSAYNEVSQRWIATGGIVISVGGKNERIIGEEIGENLDSKHYFNLMGETTIYELMYLLKNANRILANDSGVMHLAAAFGKKGVAVFGSTDYTATGPIASNWDILYSKQECSPCFKRCCPNGDAKCMSEIAPDDVWKVLNSGQ